MDQITKRIPMQSSAVATGNGTAISTTGYDFVALDISGITTATITFEITEDESTWRSVTAINRSTKAESTTATADGSYIVNVAGAVKMRARISSWNSGTIIVYGRAGKGPMPVGGTSTVDTELPAAAALADATANPTVPAVGSFMHGFNGTTWDRIRTAVTAVSSTFTGFLNSLPWAIYHASPSSRTDGQGGPFEADASGNLKQTLATALSRVLDSISVALATDAIMVGNVELTPKFAPIAASASGNNTIVAAVTGKKIRVLFFKISSSGTVNWKWQSGAGGTDLTGLTYGVVNTVDKGDFCPFGHFETAAATLLNLNLSGATAVGGYVIYVEV